MPHPRSSSSRPPAPSAGDRHRGGESPAAGDATYEARNPEHRGADVRGAEPRAGDAPRGQGGGTEPDLRAPVVGVVMGSDSDLPVVQKCLDLLEQFDIPYEASVLSAHRTPERAHEYASTARLRGLKIIIAAAGGAAHLAGVMAALTTIPVIGIPMATASLGGADSLYSTVQMPAGVPVATVAIGDAGAANAALLSAQILALNDEELQHRLLAYRADLRRRVAEKNDRLREHLNEAR